MFTSHINKNKTILLIDDDKVTHILLGEILSDKIIVLNAENGVTGMDILNLCCDDIDLILLDLFLPNESGFQIFNEIKKQNSEVPIIAVTAAPIIEVKNQCLEAGFNEILSKPIDIYELQDTINKYLN